SGSVAPAGRSDAPAARLRPSTPPRPEARTAAGLPDRQSPADRQREDSTPMPDAVVGNPAAAANRAGAANRAAVANRAVAAIPIEADDRAGPVARGLPAGPAVRIGRGQGRWAERIGRWPEADRGGRRRSAVRSFPGTDPSADARSGRRQSERRPGK